MKVNSDSAVFDAIIAEAAKQNIDVLNDYGENDPFTETPEFEKMMDEVYANIEKNINAVSKKKKLLRPVTVIAAALVMVLLFAAINVSAFKVFFYKTYLDIQGDILNIETDTVGMLEQYKSISNYKLKDQLLVPGWLPKGTDLISIEDTAYIVKFIYKYDGKELYLEQKAIPNEYDGMTNLFFLERSDYKFVENYTNGVSAYIGTIEGDTGNIFYVALWGDDNTIYSLGTNGSEILLKSVLSSLKSI